MATATTLRLTTNLLLKKLSNHAGTKVSRGAAPSLFFRFGATCGRAKGSMKACGLHNGQIRMEKIVSDLQQIPIQLNACADTGTA